MFLCSIHLPHTRLHACAVIMKASKSNRDDDSLFSRWRAQPGDRAAMLQQYGAAAQEEC